MVGVAHRGTQGPPRAALCTALGSGDRWGPLGPAPLFTLLAGGVPVQGPKGLRASLDDARRGGGRGKPGGAGWVAESVPDCESPRPLRAEIEGS